MWRRDRTMSPVARRLVELARDVAGHLRQLPLSVMASAEPCAVAERFVEALERRDWSGFGELLAADGRVTRVTDSGPSHMTRRPVENTSSSATDHERDAA